MSTQSHALEPSFSNIITPDAETASRLAVISRAKQLAESFKQITVNSSESYTVAGQSLVAIKTLRGELEGACRPTIDARYKSHKEALREFKEGDSPLEQIEMSINRALLAYKQEQERKRKAEQARLQAEEDKKAREEAQRLAEEEKLQQAIAAEESGDKEAADQIMAAPVVAAPVFVAPVVLAKTTPKIAGLSERQNWKFEIENANLIPREYLMPDEKKIGALVRALKEQTKIPGVKVWPEDSLAGTGRG